MGWARVDDSLDGHPKRELVSLAADGLLLRALARCAGRETDGYVEGSWVNSQSRPAERRRALADLLAHGLLEELPAGESRTLNAASRPGLRIAAREIVVGPHPLDGYLVHDYLDYNFARVEMEERRAKERRKKAGQRSQARLPWDDLKASVPEGHAPVSPGVSPLKGDTGYGYGEVPPGSESGSNDAHARAARSSDPGVQRVLDVLAEAPRLFVDAVGVENAIRAFPTGDPVKAAHEAVTLGRDPAWRITNAARLMWRALEGQTSPRTGTTPFGSRRADRPTAADFLALREGAA